jgi:hypothetical protein
LSDFSFADESDRSRAIAAFISPALAQGGLLSGRVPVDLSEADQSQTGKGYRAKAVAGIYNNVPRIVTQSKGGVGGLEESLSQELMNGRPFISFDNIRGKIDCPALESALTEDYYSARVPYSSGVDIDMRRTTIEQGRVDRGPG